jgi:molybdate transport system regulatory protein
MIKNEDVIEDLSPRIKIWLELDGEMILGKGGALLLRAIEEKGSISQAVKALPAGALGESEPPSYRFAWGYLQKVEKRLGAAIVEKHRGYGGGKGGTALTLLGQKLLKYYEELEQKIERALVAATKSH